jgi:hypothetical protein
MNQNLPYKKKPSQSGKSLWHLPEVSTVIVNRVRYNNAKLRFENGRLVKKFQAIELLLNTSNEFPVRALSPALFIGERILSDFQIVGRNSYKFYAFNPEGLEQGMPIFIGWPGFPKTKIKTRFLLNFERPDLV